MSPLIRRAFFATFTFLHPPWYYRAVGDCYIHGLTEQALGNTVFNGLMLCCDKGEREFHCIIVKLDDYFTSLSCSDVVSVFHAFALSMHMIELCDQRAVVTACHDHSFLTVAHPMCTQF
jgi:hypothetical protein